MLRQRTASPMIQSNSVGLTEYHIFALLDEWQGYRDPVLADLSRRLLRRSLFKAIDVDPRKYNRMQRFQKRAEELVRAQLPHVTPTTVQYYVSVDEPLVV